jgi:hypothetical protein
VGTVTRLELFKDIADELGDLISLTATATGTTTTFVAASDMLYADGGLNGREAWYATAGAGSVANKWTRRIVTDTDEASGTITVSPAWSAAPISGDVLLLVNSRGTGVTIPETHRKINQLLRRVRSELATEVADTPATFAATAPVINIPAAWDAFLGIQIERSSALTGVWDALIGKPYSINHWDSPKTVTIAATHRGLCHGKRLRLIGAIDLTELSSDTDATTAPAAWLAKTAAFELLEAAALRSGDVATAFTYGELLKAQAMEMKQYVGKRFGLGPRIELRQ